MPSPIAHSAVAFLLWPALKDRGRCGSWTNLKSPRGWLLLGGVLFMLNAPDLDFVPHLLMGAEADSPWMQHGYATHSLLVGAVAAVIFAAVFRPITGIRALRLFIVGLLAWWSHIVFDYFTLRGGVAAFWPFVEERFVSPVPLFYGVRHSEPWAWHLHLITISTELVFAGLLWCTARLTSRRRKGCRTELQDHNTALLYGR